MEPERPHVLRGAHPRIQEEIRAAPEEDRLVRRALGVEVLRRAPEHPGVPVERPPVGPPRPRGVDGDAVPALRERGREVDDALLGAPEEAGREALGIEGLRRARDVDPDVARLLPRLAQDVAEERGDAALREPQGRALVLHHREEGAVVVGRVERPLEAVLREQAPERRRVVGPDVPVVGRRVPRIGEVLLDPVGGDGAGEEERPRGAEQRVQLLQRPLIVRQVLQHLEDDDRVVALEVREVDPGRALRPVVVAAHDLLVLDPPREPLRELRDVAGGLGRHVAGDDPQARSGGQHLRLDQSVLDPDGEDVDRRALLR